MFTVMMVLGVGSGVIQLLGCHVCFRTTISIERKKLYYWIWVYMMALIGLLVAFVLANLIGLVYWLSASSAFRVRKKYSVYWVRPHKFIGQTTRLVTNENKI